MHHTTKSIITKSTKEDGNEGGRRSGNGRRTTLNPQAVVGEVEKTLRPTSKASGGLVVGEVEQAALVVSTYNYSSTTQDSRVEESQSHKSIAQELRLLD
ncbi:hypothetical protein L6452_43463 [Arctium lappa]|uniref:Uncharacterized protein n=1 Tax=Arctium lappa TaxID=4217 RepID=A0ACB8XER4_ARCLA|nr:hypothetical protein L6452_43463 [Arctium lappa]